MVDLFAGSGALGLEALSRGAAQVTFVDNDRRAQRVIATNLANLELADRALIVGTDAFTYLASAEPVDLLLCDPPYQFDEWDRLLALAPAPVVMCESNREISAPDRWRVAKQKRYGTSVVTILTAEPLE